MTHTGRLTIDAPTRVFHWMLASCFMGAYLTGDSERWRAVHLALGYMVIALIGFRIIYGVVGPRHARLSALLRKMQGWSAWLRALRWSSIADAGTWNQAQNRVLASITVLMIIWVLPTVLTGYLCDKACDSPIGGELLAGLHELFANGLVMLVMLHLSALAAVCLLRRRNLALPMLTGRTQGSGPGPVRKNRRWLAALLLIGVVAYGVWEWRMATGA